MDDQLTMHVGDEVELTIESLAFGGEGVAKVKMGEKAFTVFVEEVVPGDIVKVRITRKKRNWARGFVKEVVKPSGLRVEPRCKHFGSAFGAGGSFDLSKGCGGCVWQFLSYDQQLKIKEQQVRDAIERLGGLSGETVLPIIGSENPWFYRNKMEFSFSRALSGELTLGLHLKRRHHDVIELEECFLLGDYVGDLVKGVRDFFRAIDQAKKIAPELRLESLTIREGKNTGEIMLMISAENGEQNFMDDFQEWVLKFFAEKKLTLTSLYFIHHQNHAGQKKTTNEKLIHGAATIQEELKLAAGEKKLKFQISPLAFFQPNTKQAEILYSKALEAAKLSGKEVVYDLFCGTGTIGMFCSLQARKVYGIELNASAIENARENAKLNDIKNIEFLVGDVDKHLPALQEKPDVIVVDPPRNGMELKVIEKILAFNPKRIVYVSCNPTTLARDLKLITKTGYTLEKVQPVDMFPQTYHIENVATLSRL